MKHTHNQSFVAAFKFYFSFYKKRIGKKLFFVSLLTFMAGIFESFGVLLILPILQTINTDLSIGTIEVSNTSQYIIIAISTFFSFLNLKFSVLNILVFMCIAFFAKGYFVFLTHRFSALLTARLIPSLKLEFIKKIQKLNYLYFIQHDSGIFTNLVNEQVNKSIIAFTHLINTITHFLTAIMYIGVGLIVSPTFGVVSAIIGASIIYGFKRISILVRRLSIDNSTSNTKLTQLIIELVFSYKYLKATRSFGVINHKINSLVRELEKHRFRTGFAEAVTMSVREPFLTIMLAVVLIIQMQYFRIDVSVTLVAMVLFYRGMNSVFNAQRSWQNTLEFSGSIDFLDYYLKEFRYEKVYKDKLESRNGGSVKNWEKLVLEDVSFTYGETGSNMVLRNLNLSFGKNKLTVILGASGSGKTTLLDLIIGLVRPSSGEIFLASKTGERSFASDMTDFKFGFVSQDAAIFTDTIENNITLWNHENLPEADLKDRLKSVVELAELSDFINSLPDGLQTPLGDRGITVSGGQRQRIYLARELFKKPEFLILDEATSALDQHTEEQILNSLQKLKSQITVIFVTHRKSIGLLADDVIKI